MPNAPDLHPLRRSGEGKGTGAAGHDRVQHAAMGGYCRLSRPPNTHNLPVPASKPAKPPLPEPSEVTKTNCATGPLWERAGVRGARESGACGLPLSLTLPHKGGRNIAPARRG